MSFASHSDNEDDGIIIDQTSHRVRVAAILTHAIVTHEPQNLHAPTETGNRLKRFPLTVGNESHSATRQVLVIAGIPFDGGAYPNHIRTR